jgi:hypothetical protein
MDEPLSTVSAQSPPAADDLSEDQVPPTTEDTTLDLPIAQRKVPRSCAKYSVSQFVS